MPSTSGSPWRRLPLLGRLVGEWRAWRREWARPHSLLTAESLGSAEQPPYPIDFVDMLALPYGVLDAHGVPFNVARPGYQACYQPTTIAQYALGLWNAYLKSGDVTQGESFVRQAEWLVDNAQELGNGMLGWPIQQPVPEFYAFGPWLSALTQGNVISVLVRAYRLTGEGRYLDTAQAAARTFETDILDGGVASTVGHNGLQFEEVAVYPAAHILNGFVLALFGLYDLVALTADERIQELVDRSLATLHTFMDEYDVGYWTRYDLLRKPLASVYYHALHATLLEALARHSGCEHCAQLAARWRGYLTRRSCRVRYLIASRFTRFMRARAGQLRLRWYGTPVPIDGEAPLRVCVPITAFPMQGGMRSVLEGVHHAMRRDWQIEFLTRLIGPDSTAYAIESFELRHRPFGKETSSPLLFPNVLFYLRAGGRKLESLVRQHRRYHLILPQDGVFTAAFAARIAKHAGVRVVSMDHGNVARGRVYQTERINALQGRSWPDRMWRRLRLALYWPTVRYLLRRATRDTDMFLVSGDDVELTYVKRLGVPPRRIVRYPYTIDADHYRPLDGSERADARTAAGIAADAVVITMVCRLSQEKGLDVALPGIARALELLAPEARACVQVLLAGSGPLQAQVEADIARLGLGEHVTLYGEIPHEAVAGLVGMSDVFLYTSTRGGGSPVAVLEAMSCGCAVIASTQPESLAAQLGEGRGIPIPPGDVEAVAQALVRLVDDPALRRQMGQAARQMIVARHSAEALRRCLLRATFFAPSIHPATEAAIADTAVANEGTEAAYANPAQV